MGELKRIYCVDDEPDIRELTEIALTVVPDFEVLTFATADEALAAVADTVPDLILLDIMMPVIDGLLFIKMLRQIEGAGEVPIVFVTARPDSPKIQRLDGLGALGVIAKPYDPIGLAAQVQEIWQGAA